MDGEAHRALRKWLRPGFSREAISAKLPQMLAALEAAVRTWQPDDQLNVTDLFQFLIAQMSGIAFTGCPIDHHFPDARTFAHTFLGAGIGSFPGFMRQLPKYRLARRRFLAFLRQLVANYQEVDQTEHQPNLIDLLLQEDTPLDTPLDEADILANIHMPYTNSLVYVAATCGFMLYELLKHPDILAEVQGEVDDLFANGPTDFGQLWRTKWLRATLLETQRLHPIALSTPRYVSNSFTHEGFYIPAGSLTLTATAVTHFLPAFFPKPTQFDPSRYWAPRFEHRQSGMLVPYGIGPHSCLSAGVVNGLILLCVGGLLHKTAFALEPDNYELRISVAPFPAPAKSFRVRVEQTRQDQDHTEPVDKDDKTFADVWPEVDLESLSRAVGQARRRNIAPGELIIREGDLAAHFYIIVAGEVDVQKTLLDSAPRSVARLGTGDYFGEIGLLHGVRRTASVKAVTIVELIELDRSAFVALVADTDLTSSEIATQLHRRLISTTLSASLPKLTLDQVAEIAPKFAVRTYGPEVDIIQQGEPANDFYVLLRGQVNVISNHPDGRQIHLAQLDAGEYFGEIGLLQGRPRNATVRTTPDQEALVMVLGREDFQAMMNDSRATNDVVALLMARRLNKLIEQKVGSMQP